MGKDKKESKINEEEAKELDLENLEQVVGGSLRDKIVLTPTTEISQDTKNKI